MFFLLPTVGSLVDNRAYFALYPGGTSSLEQTTVPLAANSLRTVYKCVSEGGVGIKNYQNLRDFIYDCFLRYLVICSTITNQCPGTTNQLSSGLELKGK